MLGADHVGCTIIIMCYLEVKRGSKL